MSFHCPKCKDERVGTIDSRDFNQFNHPAIRRRHRCKRCDFRWSTIEIEKDLLLEMIRAFKEMKKSILRVPISPMVKEDKNYG